MEHVMLKVKLWSLIVVIIGSIIKTNNDHILFLIIIFLTTTQWVVVNCEERMITIQILTITTFGNVKNIFMDSKILLTTNSYYQRPSVSRL
jgi:hypothetical protein